MFFIGIFGIDNKQKYIGTFNNFICPSCGAWTRLEIFKAYTYFHIFFIPLFRWNKKYLVKPACCGRLYELDPAVGSDFEKNPDIQIRKEDLRDFMPGGGMAYRYCSNCSINVPPEYRFCPYCGRQL